jgi:hypothetical protein
MAVRAPEMLYALTTHLPSAAVARLACTCTLLADALVSDQGAEGMQAAAAAAAAAAVAAAAVGAAGGAPVEGAAAVATPSPASTCLAFHPKDDPSLSKLRLHGLLPIPAIGAYASAVRTSGVEIVPYPGLYFYSYADLEAAAVTLLELAEAGGGGAVAAPGAAEAGAGATGGGTLGSGAGVGGTAGGGMGGAQSGDGTGGGGAVGGGATDGRGTGGGAAGGGGTAFVVEFNWRAETLAQFFISGSEASTRSALTKVGFCFCTFVVCSRCPI